MDEGENVKVEKLLKEARVTLVEHHLMQACIMSVDNVSGARDKVNLQVRGFDAAQIVSSDLHTGLWMCAARVVAGESFH